MRFSTIIVAVFIAICVSWMPLPTTAEEVYRWVDENGVVHFGDRAPEQGDAEKVTIQASAAVESAPATDPASPYTEPTQPSYAQQIRDERAAQRQERAQAAEVTSGICQQARDVVAQLEPSPRVNVTHEDGTVTRMDDNDRLEKLSEAKAFISENCSKFP